MTDTVRIILAAGSNLWDPTVLSGLALIGACLLLLGLMRRKAVRTAGPRDYTREAVSRIREQQGVAHDMETLIVKLSEAARELNAQMDTRFAKLEQVIAEADQKTAELKALLRKASGGQKVDIVVGDNPPAEPAAPALPPAKLNKQRKPNKPPRKTDEPAKPATRPAPTPAPVVPASAAAVTPAAVPAAPAKAVEPAEPADPRYGRIYALADQGQAPIEIARQTGQTTGEIELILNLRKSCIG